jgi:putative ATP-binding cassette transporter
MKLLSTLLRYSRSSLLVASLAGVFAGLCSAGLLALVHLMLRQPEKGGQLLWPYVGLTLLVPVASVFSTYLLMRLGQQAVVDLRLDLSRQILRTPLARLEQLGSHRLLAALTEDVTALTQAVVLVPAACMSGAMVVGCLAYLSWLSWRMFLVLFVLLIVGSASYQLPVVMGSRRLRMYREVGDMLYNDFRGLTEGLKELKLNRERRGDFLATLERNSLQLRNLGVSAITLFSAASSWGLFLLFAVLGGLLFSASHLLPADRQALSGFVLALLFLLGPLQSLLAGLPQIGRANAALAKIEKLGLTLRSTMEAAESVPPQPETSWRRLQLRGVTHTYDGDGDEGAFTLGPVDLELAPGELVFITGGNGSGKTTLAKILAGLYPPDSGEIWLDGQLIGNRQLDAYRQRFSAVFSDYYLFAELLGIRRPDLDAEARACLARLQLDRKVQVEGGKLSNIRLSQGQRKRLALLTAYLEDRPIYLFDEWAADQDPYFKEIFYRQILPELKARGKCVCVISHDDRYYTVADRVVKLESGNVVSHEVQAATPTPQAIAN